MKLIKDGIFEVKRENKENFYNTVSIGNNSFDPFCDCFYYKKRHFMQAHCWCFGMFQMLG